ARVLRLAAEAERDLLADPAYRAELARWAGGYRDRDGIPGSALGPRSPEGRDPVREFAPERRQRPGTAGGQSFFRVRAIAPMAGASVSHSPIVTTMDVM